MPPNQVNWTDSETKMLLDILLEYKNKCIEEQIDWSTCKTRYDSVFESFLEEYGKKTEDENFPHKSDLTIYKKVMIINKIKRIKTNYSKAVESGNKSGNGRHIYIFREVCDNIWSGSPSVEAVAFGVETEGDDRTADNSDQEGNDIEDVDESQPDDDEGNISTSSTPSTPSSSSQLSSQQTPTSAREVINNKVNRSSRLRGKIGHDDMYLKAIGIEQNFKKKCINLWEATNNELKAGVNEMKKMNETMAQGFTVMTSVLQQMQESRMQQQHHFHPYNPPPPQQQPSYDPQDPFNSSQLVVYNTTDPQ